jgi:HD-like signal output (HDOD) protein
VVVAGKSLATPPALRNLPPFPPAAGRLLSLLSNDNTAFGEVARIISTDAALSAEVLRLANSPLAGRYGANTILQALSLLGLARVGNLVLTLSVSRLLRRAGRSDIVRRCWRHNLACGLAAREFAQAFDVDADQAYTGGILHDIGRLALVAANPGQYQSISFTSGSVREEERRLFGIDRNQAGAWLIQQWLLPAIYLDVVGCHDETPAEARPLANVVHAGCAVAGQIGFSVSGITPDAQEPVASDDLSMSIATTINAIECEYGL